MTGRRRVPRGTATAVVTCAALAAVLVPSAPAASAGAPRRDGQPGRAGQAARAGRFTEFDVPTAGSFPLRIATGADGNLWFTEQDADKIGRLVISSPAARGREGAVVP